MIHQDTVRLLRECDAGVKMGIASLDDVMPHVKNEHLRARLDACRQGHKTLSHDIQQMLSSFHDEGKEPNPMAKGMSRIKTNVKLGLDDSDATVADLMTDGCDMGVKSLSKYLNRYSAASEDSKDLCKRLVQEEARLAIDLRPYL